MPTAKVTANTAAQTLWTTPKHKKGKLTALNIDNQGSAKRTIKIQDVFTPDPSTGVPSPTEHTLERVQVSVDVGLSASLDEASLENVEFLGTAKAVADAADAGCVIIAVYTFEEEDHNA